MKNTLENWSRSKQLNLTLVFTDIVESTAIGQKKGDELWIEYLTEHFRKGRELAQKYDCFVVKVIGDAFMLAFRTSSQAVRFAIEFSENTGNELIGIRVGIHAGEVQIMDNDIYGLNVNKTARIQSSVSREGIMISTVVKEDFQKKYGRTPEIGFLPVKRDLKNFGHVQLWTIRSTSLRNAYKKTILNRRALIGDTVQIQQPIDKTPVAPKLIQNENQTPLQKLLSRLPPITEVKKIKKRVSPIK